MKASSGFLPSLTAAALACLTVAVTFVPHVTSVPVRTVLALPLVLVLPGYALLSALLPRLDCRSAEGLAFSLGLSLSATILTGLALNYTPWGIERRPMAIALGAITLVATSAAWVRRLRSADSREHHSRPRPTAGQLILLTLAVLTVVAALGVARLGATQAEGRTTFTELWMLPAKGAAGLEGTSLRLGIRNSEGSRKTYRLLVRADGRRLAIWPSISVDSRKQWTVTLRLSGDLSTRRPVEAELFRADQPGIYRRVTFWPRETQTRR